MRKWMYLIPSILLVGSVLAEEKIEIEEEEGCEETDFCLPEEGKEYSRHYHCPHRYYNYYYYADRDTDASWPGRRENSFMEKLMR